MMPELKRNGKMNERIAAFVIGILLLIALLITATQAVCYWVPDWWRTEYAKYNTPQYVTGEMSLDDAVYITDQMLEYCIGRLDTLDDTTATIDGVTAPFFTQREKLHLADCRNIFIGAVRFRIISVLLIIAFLLAIWFSIQKRHDRQAADAAILGSSGQSGSSVHAGSLMQESAHAGLGLADSSMQSNAHAGSGLTDNSMQSYAHAGSGLTDSSMQSNVHAGSGLTDDSMQANADAKDGRDLPLDSFGDRVVMRNYFARTLSAGYLKALIALVVFAIFLIIVGMHDFTFLFTKFHHVFFDNDLWILDPRKDNLVNVMQESVFSDAAIWIGSIWGAAALIIAVISVIILRKTPRD